jgi:hypothetical protein
MKLVSREESKHTSASLTLVEKSLAGEAIEGSHGDKISPGMNTHCYDVGTPASRRYRRRTVGGFSRSWGAKLKVSNGQTT